MCVEVWAWVMLLTSLLKAQSEQSAVVVGVVELFVDVQTFTREYVPREADGEHRGVVVDAM